MDKNQATAWWGEHCAMRAEMMRLVAGSVGRAESDAMARHLVRTYLNDHMAWLPCGVDAFWEMYMPAFWPDLT